MDSKENLGFDLFLAKPLFAFIRLWISQDSNKLHKEILTE